MKLFKPRLGLFSVIAGFRALLAGSVWIGAPLFPTIIATQLIDHGDGLIANGGTEPHPRTYWGKGFIGYRGRDYIADAIMYYALFSFIAIHGLLAPFFPYYLIFFFVYPVVTYLRYTNPDSAVGVIGPPSGLFLFLVALAYLFGFNPILAGLVALGLNPVIETQIHSQDWNISPSRIPLYVGLTSLSWLVFGVVTTRLWENLLIVLPIISIISAENLRG